MFPVPPAADECSSRPYAALHWSRSDLLQASVLSRCWLGDRKGLYENLLQLPSKALWSNSGNCKVGNQGLNSQPDGCMILCDFDLDCNLKLWLETVFWSLFSEVGINLHKCSTVKYWFFDCSYLQFCSYYNAILFNCNTLLKLIYFFAWFLAGSRPRGRPKRTWREVVQKDCQACNLNREDAMDCSRWKKLIKTGWRSGRWVGVCFFWYQLTRVVPDKGL